ncbi:unnamed protein product [Malus baccata var. baccata]
MADDGACLDGEGFGKGNARRTIRCSCVAINLGGDMDKQWIHNPNRCDDDYLDGINQFIDFAIANNPIIEYFETVRYHLVRNGMMETSTTWNHHGEQIQHASFSHITRVVETVESVVDPNEQIIDIINDAFPNASSNTHEEVEDDVSPTMDSEAFEKYEERLKSDKRMLPKDNCLLKDHKNAKKLLSGLGLGYEKIHACNNNCILFCKENKALDKCPICNESRPRLQRLQRLYMSTHTVSNMRWQKDRRVDDDVMRHHADGKAWKGFNRLYPNFACEP